MNHLVAAALLLISASSFAKNSLEAIVHCKQAQIISGGDEVILFAGLAQVSDIKAALKKKEDFSFSGLLIQHFNRPAFDRMYKNVTLERKGTIVMAKKPIESRQSVEFAELTLEDPGTLAPTLSVGNSESSYGVQLLCTFED